MPKTLKLQTICNAFRKYFKHAMCLGNISSNFNQTDRISAELNGYVYDFIADYNAIPNDKIRNKHKYLMEKNNVV